MSLAWVLAQGENVHAIPGTASVTHLEENFETFKVSIHECVLNELSALIKQDTVSGHRYAEAMRKTSDTEDYA